MGYVRITIHLAGGGTRSGIRPIPEPMKLDDIRTQALQLASQTLGRASIADVTVEEVPAGDPEVVALILRDQANKRGIPRSDGDHPYIKGRRGKRGH